MNKRHFRALVVCGLVVLLVAAVGCKGGKKRKRVEPRYPTTTTPAPIMEESTTGEALPEISAERLESLLFDKATGLMPVYFDFDKYTLRPDAIAILKENADKIKQVPGIIIQIEGHCDERGTQEYNLALGEKRALAAREFLMKLGVSGDRLITISYGEERPADLGHNEQAWAKNRRSEFNRAL